MKKRRALSALSGTPEEHDAARVRAVLRFQDMLNRPRSCDSALEAFRAAVVRHRETRYIRASEHVDPKLYLARSKEDMELARGLVKRACGCSATTGYGPYRELGRVRR